jgi:putative addiction module component (TIGR02574 family)
MSSATLAKLRTEALDLSESERAELAHELITSLDGPADPDVENAWSAEISKRLNAIENGTATTMSGDEVLRAMARRIRKD